MTSPPRSIPPGTTLHRDWTGAYHLTPSAMPSYGPRPSYGMPSYPSPYGMPSPYPSPYGMPPMQSPSYSAPPGHVLVPINDLQHLMANQPSSNSPISPPHHSVYSIHPNGSVNDASHSHPHLHGSSAQAPVTTIGSPGPQSPQPRWTQ